MKADWCHVLLLYGLLFAVTQWFPGCAYLRDANQDAKNFYDHVNRQTGGGPH